MLQVLKHILVALAVALFTVPAFADHGCMPQAKMTAELMRLYKERPVATGVSDGGRLLVIYKAPMGTTWTITLARSDGMACILAAGTGWHMAKEPGA